MCHRINRQASVPADGYIRSNCLQIHKTYGKLKKTGQKRPVFRLKTKYPEASASGYFVLYQNQAIAKEISVLYFGPPGPIFPILRSIFANFLRFIQAYVSPAFILILAFPFI